MAENLRTIYHLTLLAVIVMALAAFLFLAPTTVHAAGVCPAPGTGLAGAANMLLDKTMWTIPMSVDAAQGSTGMFRAVGNTSCP